MLREQGGPLVKTVTHYETLGVARSAPEEVIRGAYKALAQKNHPDKNLDNPNATNIMQAINEAYDVLSDPLKKASYDAALSSRQDLAEWDPADALQSAPAAEPFPGQVRQAEQILCL